MPINLNLNGAREALSSTYNSFIGKSPEEKTVEKPSTSWTQIVQENKGKIALTVAAAVAATTAIYFRHEIAAFFVKELPGGEDPVKENNSLEQYFIQKATKEFLEEHNPSCESLIDFCKDPNRYPEYANHNMTDWCASWLETICGK